MSENFLSELNTTPTELWRGMITKSFPKPGNFSAYSSQRLKISKKPLPSYRPRTGGGRHPLSSDFVAGKDGYRSRHKNGGKQVTDPNAKLASQPDCVVSKDNAGIHSSPWRKSGGINH
jgi:hypothetical protein